jgi:hypothetical protein
MRDPRNLDFPRDSFQIGDVAPYEAHRREFVFFHDQAQTVRIGCHVEDCHGDAFPNQVANHPRADTAERPRDEKMLVRHAVFPQNSVMVGLPSSHAIMFSTR